MNRGRFTIKNIVKKLISFILLTFFTLLATAIFLEPIQKNLIPTLANIPNSIIASFVDSIYKDLPMYQMNSTKSFTSSLISGVFLSISFFLLVEVSMLPMSLKNHAPDDSSDNPPEETSSTPLDDAELKISKGIYFIKHGVYAKLNRHKLRILKTILVACFLYVHSFLLYNIVISTTIEATAIETINRIEIASPYIEDIEYKKLKSKFYSIENFNDYKSLENDLNTIEATYKLTKDHTL